MGKHLRVERHGDTVVVHFIERKIAADVVVAALGQELYEVVARPDCLKLTLNFAGVDFLSSAMFGKLVTMRRVMADKGGTLTLCEMCPNVRLIFRLTCLDRILHIEEAEPGD